MYCSVYSYGQMYTYCTLYNKVISSQISWQNNSTSIHTHGTKLAEYDSNGLLF
jgi:hypothetical protein